MAIKIKNKTKQINNNTLRQHQEKDILNYGKNILSITTDNGSEFRGYKKYCRSIYNFKDNIKIYFCNPFYSSQKGQIENGNRQIRKFFPNNTNLSKISEEQINFAIKEINSKFRETLGCLSTNESYNYYVN